jgi:hypothetical protein
MTAELKPLIYTQMSKILAEIKGVEKDRKMEGSGPKYNYRSIDDVYNELHSILGTHGVFVAPEVVKADYSDVTSSNQKLQTVCRLLVKFTFYATDGSSVSMVTPGEGIDSYDKATNKAMSGAQKYALIQAFLIPTGEDTDHENSPKEKYAPPTAKKSISQAEALKTTPKPPTTPSNSTPNSPPPTLKQPPPALHPNDLEQILSDAEPPEYPFDDNPAVPPNLDFTAWVSNLPVVGEGNDLWYNVEGKITQSTQRAHKVYFKYWSKDAWIPIKFITENPPDHVQISGWILLQKEADLTGATPA